MGLADGESKLLPTVIRITATVTYGYGAYLDAMRPLKEGAVPRFRFRVRPPGLGEGLQSAHDAPQPALEPPHSVPPGLGAVRVTAAFADAPALAADFEARHRSSAARYAALAGCGRGGDVAGLSEPERARWRTQARQWLRADLAAWGETLDANPAAARDDAKRRLERWRTDPDPDGLRAPAELDNLPASERKDCVALWAEVDAALARRKR
jgi:hypothetical protein